ncbi:MAG TPA: hypothetical protein VG057_18875 [Solirubrobacteraceae bacterium]|jgi:heme exporter protein D|nr:hypothetical protein [Solirubrobacteraceae bacterium]
MSTPVIVFLNVFFIAFVLVTIVGLCAWSVVADKSLIASIADQRARRRAAIQRRSRATAPAARRSGRALDLGA